MALKSRLKLRTKIRIIRCFRVVSSCILRVQHFGAMHPNIHSPALLTISLSLHVHSPYTDPPNRLL